MGLTYKSPEIQATISMQQLHSDDITTHTHTHASYTLTSEV
jgi:hypothetical protein